MADNLGLIIQVNYASSQRNIDDAIKKLQEYVNTKNLNITFDTASLKGLDQISKAIAPSINQVNNLNSSMQNLGRTMENVNKKSVIETKQNGILTEIKEIKELENAFGQLTKVTEIFNAKSGSKQINEETTNLKKQREAIDALNASKMKMLQSLEPFKMNPAFATEVSQIAQGIKGLDLTNISKTNIQEILGQINTLKQLAREVENVRKEEERLAREQLKQQEQAERNIQRQQQLYAGLFNQTERSIQQQSRLLNTRMQSALGLGNSISNNLTPESSRVLEHQLERYRNIIRQFQENNQIGITIRPEQLTQLQNLENRIRRFYDTVRSGQNDSHGFNFTQYDQFTRLNPAITNATHAQQYYNTSLLEGHRLIASNIQQTEQYIRVTQQLRNGSQHLNLGVYIDRATGQMYQFNEALRDGMTRSWGLGEAMSTAATKAMVWSVVMGTMYSFLNILQQIPTAIIEIDTRLVEMSKVMSSSTDYGALMDSLSESASNYGRTITETQDAVVEFGKQGFEAAQAMEMANTALLGANVTGLKTNQMAGYLTATMAQFNIVAEDSVSIVNKINEVDNNFAVTSQGLAQSLAKAGESAQLYGASLDNVIGYTTAIQTATKESGNVIGNSLKSTISRTFSDDSEKILNSVGIAIRDISGEVRTVDQIWSDLAIKFKILSNEQKQQIGLTIGSRYHLTRFLALMDNWDIVTKATTTSQQSLFSALEENRKHLASLESQINKVKSAGQELAYTLGENGLGAAMSGVLGVTTTFIKGLNVLANLSTSLKVTITTLSASLVIYAIGIANITSAITKLGIAMKVMALSNPWLAVIAGLATLTVAAAGYLGKQKQLKEDQDKITQTVEKSTKAFNDLKASMDKIGVPKLQDVNDAEAQIKKYDELILKIAEVEKSQKGKGQYIHDDNGKLVKSDLPFDPTKLSDEMKDLSTNLGIDILQIETWAEFVAEAKKKQDELNGSLEKGKDNSTEYQAEQIKASQTQLDVANNTKSLVEEYKELSSITEKNEQQTKRFAEVKNMLLGMFPEESANGKIIIEALDKEAKKRVELAEAASKGSKQQLEANRKATQSAYETAVKNMALYQGEIDRLRELWDARTNNSSALQSDDIGGISILETSRLGKQIREYDTAKSSVDSLAKSISEMDDVLNWKPASVSSGGDDSKPSSSKSSDSSKIKDPSYTSPVDAIISEINAQSDLTAEKNKAIEASIAQAKTDKDYSLQLKKTNELISSQKIQLTELSAARDKINYYKDSAISTSKFGDTSKWFNDQNEASTAYIYEKNNASAEVQETMETEFAVMQKLRKAYVDNKKSINDLKVSMDTLKTSLVAISQEQITEVLGQKDFALATKLINELLKSQADQLSKLQIARDKINADKDNLLSSSSSQFGDISSWFVGDDNQKSALYLESYNNASIDTKKTMDDLFSSMQILRNGWIENSKLIKENTKASKEFSKTSKDVLVKAIKEQNDVLSSTEITALDKNFESLDIEKWIKNNITATDNWADASKRLEAEISKIGTPTTLESQQKYNELLESSAKLTWDALQAQKALQKEIAKVKQQAIFDSLDAEMQAITDQIDNVGTQIDLLKDGRSSLNTDLNYSIVPQISYDTADEAAAKYIAEKKESEFEYKAPITFVSYIDNEFNNAVTKASTAIDNFNEKIAKLGPITPENKEEALGYYADIQTAIGNLSTTAETAQKNLKINLELGNITQEDYDLKLSQIKVASLSVLAIPIIEMNEEAQTSFNTFKAEVAAIPVDANTKPFDDKILEEISKKYETTITANLEHAVADEAILALTANSIKKIEVQYVYPNSPTIDVSATSFAKGTKFSPEGLAIVDDEGTGKRELRISPDGEMILGDNTGPKLVPLEAGSTVIPNKETEELLKLMGVPAYANGNYTVLRGGNDEGKIVGMSGGIWIASDGYRNFKYTPPHWEYQGIPYYPPNDPSDPANSKASSPTSAKTSSSSKTATSKSPSETLTPTANSSTSETVSLIDEKISLWELSTVTAEKSIKTLTDKIAQYKDPTTGLYEDNETTRETIPQINTYFQAQKSAQLAIKALVKERFEAEYEGFDKSQEKTNSSISYYQSTLEYQKLIGKSVEDQLQTENVILAKQLKNKKSLEAEAIKAEADTQTAYNNVKSKLKKGEDLTTALDNSEEYILASEKWNDVLIKVQDSETDIYTTTKNIADLNLENITKPFNDIQESLESSLSYAEKLIALMKLQGKSQEEISAVTKQNILDQQEKLVSEEAELKVLEADLALQKKGTDEWTKSKAAVDAQKKAILDTKTAITQAYSDIADEIIEAYKTAYKKQEEIALATIDKQKDAYDDMIDDKLKKLNNDSSLEDYGEELKTMQDEALETEKKRDALSLDNSIEGKAKKLELSKTLAEQEAAIAKKRRHHDVELQTASLNEQKENNDKAVELEKEAVTEKFDALINDEEKYAEIRQQIYAGNFAQIQSDFAKFNADFLKQNQTTCEGLKISYSDLVNTIKQVTTATNSLGSLSSTPIPDATPKVTSPIVTPKNDSGLITSKNKVIPYLVNKGAISASEFNDLEAQNFTTQAQIMGYLIKKGYITTAEYNDLEAHVKFKEGGETSKKGLIWADGELGKPERILSGEQTQSFNSLVKNLPSITTVLDKIMLNNPLQNIMSNFAMPSFSNNLAGAMTGGATYNLNLNIESLNGDKSGADFLFSSIGNNIKKMGGKW